MASNLLFKGLSSGNGARGGLWVGLIFKTLLTFQPLFAQERDYPCENNNEINSCLGLTQCTRKCIKHVRLCSVLPRWELLILCSGGPCQHGDVGRSSRTKPCVHKLLQHEPVAHPTSTQNTTDHAQPGAGGKKIPSKSQHPESIEAIEEKKEKRKKSLNFLPWPPWLLSSLGFISLLLLSLGATFTLDFVVLLLSTLLLEIR